MFTFDHLLNSSPEIREFFARNAHTQQQCLKLSSELLIESIRKRIQLQSQQHKAQSKTNNVPVQNQQRKKDPRYNVAYIKHNRFLSPTQKRQVTPKVTEMIPVSPQKVFIYGKPKVKLDNGYGCVMHQQNCEEYLENEQVQDQKYEKQNYQPAHQDESFQNLNYTQELPRQYEEYLSPKNNLKKKSSKNQVNSNQTMGTIRSPKSRKPQGASNRMTSPKVLFNQRSEHQLNGSDYSNVQSKIKQLIQRDKKNREMQRQVQKQTQQIQQIQERQNKLFMMQKYQQSLLKQDQHSGQENEVWKIKTTTSPQHMIQNANFESDSQIQSSSSESVVNLHGHHGEQSRIQCYECEIERLKRRKQKAKKAIKMIEKEQMRRSKLLGSIAMNSQVYCDMMDHRSSGQSRSSVSIH